MDATALYLIGGLVYLLVFSGLGVYIAVQKRREPMEGLCMGAIFGPFGCVIEGLLPTIEAKAEAVE